VNERKLAILSDNPNLVLGILKSQEVGNFDISYIISSNQKYSQEIQSSINIPSEKLITISPDNPKFEDRLLSRVNLGGVTDIGHHSFPYQITENLVRNFPGRIFCQTDVNPSLYPNLLGTDAYDAAINFTHQTAGIESHIRPTIQMIGKAEYFNWYWWFDCVNITPTDTPQTLQEKLSDLNIETATKFYSHLDNLPPRCRITKRLDLDTNTLDILNECCCSLTNPISARIVA
jgi:folate-dependent phosphoribosylglycinamide formyltransferase PurN